MTTLTPVLELKEASFGYGGKTAVESVTAKIFAGDAVALIGPNGSGKSTLLKGILGIAEQTGGELFVLGLPAAKAISQIGYLPQSSHWDADIPVTVEQVVGMGLYRKLGPFQRIGREKRQQIREALAEVGLAHRAKVLFGELSGGQQQRVILARSLVNHPDIILLDEPFNGLDQPNRDALLETVKQLRNSGTAILISTHDLDLAREACTHVMLLNRTQVGFGPLDSTLTLDLIQETFSDATVELDHHTVTTTREIG